ncbi:diaminopimelate epimerase [Candidatus Methanomassiliicoccus intestinalis]|uniref:Diaminopimelate epimerase n=1 Tax=Candidatus Methanomassiliicoccus intestinalis TaxID=1406512 RepID=A0A8J8PAQ8_9ARCH|nr:MAG: diaminopimelate epimerase [Candidatus Methanomassiliicoccus intestinalis]
MKFWKYHGLGNDFVLFEDFKSEIPADPEFVRYICDRHFGIGGDGILYIRKDAEADAYMKIMNSDGSEAEMCGNGIRCFAKHLYDFGIVKSEKMKINTLGGIKYIDVKAENGIAKEVSVNMGAPYLEVKDIPMNGNGRFINKKITAAGMEITGTAVGMGNPHFVTFQDLNDEDILKLGPVLEKHEMFPRKTNVEFVTAKEDYLDVKVYERGAAWTNACGTGACATAVAATLVGICPTGKDIAIHLPGGTLSINVKNDYSSVQMTGPAEMVFEGEINW